MVASAVASRAIAVVSAVAAAVFATASPVSRPAATPSSVPAVVSRPAAVAFAAAAAAFAASAAVFAASAAAFAARLEPPAAAAASLATSAARCRASAVKVAASVDGVSGLTTLEELLPNKAFWRLGPEADWSVPGREMSVKGMLFGWVPIQAVVAAAPVGEFVSLTMAALGVMRSSRHSMVSRVRAGTLAALRMVRAGEQTANPGMPGHGRSPR